MQNTEKAADKLDFEKIISTACIIVLLATVIWSVTDPSKKQIPFERVGWESCYNIKLSENCRWKMYDDLRVNILQEEWTRDQVKNLLGPPDYEETDTSVSYLIGFLKRKIEFAPRQSAMEIEFDENDRISSIKAIIGGYTPIWLVPVYLSQDHFFQSLINVNL